MATTSIDLEETGTPASLALDKIASSIVEERVTVGQLIDKLDDRAPGILLLILSLPMCIPNVPGISTVFGMLLLLPSIQMMSGRHSLWMPKFVRNWSLKGDGLRKALVSSSRVLKRVERFSRPRASALTRWPLTIGIGAQTLIMALVLILPIWGANLIPGIAVALTGIGVLQRDGWAVAASTPVAVAAIAWVYFGTKYTIVFFVWLAEWARNLPLF